MIRVSDLPTLLTAPANTDEFLVVDKSDVSGNADGKVKKVTYSNIAIFNVVTADVTLNFGTIPANSFADGAFTTSEFLPGDWVSASPRAALPNNIAIGGAWVDSSNVTHVRLINNSTSSTAVSNVNFLVNKLYNSNFITPSFVPNDLPNNTSWFDVSDSGAITLVGSQVAQIDDKSGNANHAIQTTSSLQPIFGNDAKGNYIEFVSSGLGASQSFLEATSPINAKTIFFVCDHDGSQFSGVLGGNQTSSSHIFLHQSTYAISVDGSVSDIGSWYLDGVFQATGGNIGSPTIIGNNTRLHTVKYNAGDPATTFELISAFNSTKVGGFGGKIREIITYDEYLSDTDRAQVESYLLTKWAL